MRGLNITGLRLGCANDSIASHSGGIYGEKYIKFLPSEEFAHIFIPCGSEKPV